MNLSCRIHHGNLGGDTMSTGTNSSTSQATTRGIRTEMLIAIVGALATIIAALLSFPPFIALFQEDPTPTATVTSVGITATTALYIDTALPVANSPLPTNNSGLDATPTVTLATETPSLPIGMHVRLYADRTSGKAPLTVKLDARDSFLRAEGGEIYGCRSGACVYTWEVYSGGQRIGKPVDNSTGTFQYTFGNKGSYFITVWVCRGGGSSDCNGSGAQFIVN